MLINADTLLASRPHPAVLVPYTAAHVPVYHAWMQSPDLLSKTGSEMLTLEEEHANMRSWRDDPRKLTFIILNSRGEEQNYMVGDVNLYLLDPEAEELGGKDTVVAEVEVMVADEASRNAGMANVSLMLIMAYAREKLKVDVFVAKIKEDNEPSLKLFEKRLQFQFYKKVEAFGEIHLKLPVDDNVGRRLSVVRRLSVEESYGESVYSKVPIANTPTSTEEDTSMEITADS